MEAWDEGPRSGLDPLNTEERAASRNSVFTQFDGPRAVNVLGMITDLRSYPGA